MPYYAAYGGAVTYNGKIWVFGGDHQTGENNHEWVRKVQVYDPTTNTWKFENDMPTPQLYKTQAVVFDDDVWLFSAYVYDKASADWVDNEYVYRFSPDENKWTKYRFAPPTGFHFNYYGDIDIIGSSVYLVHNSENDTRSNRVFRVELVPKRILYVDAVNGSNDNNGLTPETAFATIQKGIDEAEDGYTILVYPGLYNEQINFLGKAITVQGLADETGVPILQVPGYFAVSFYNGEQADSVMRNFIITNSFMAVFIAGSSPTIANLTVVNNDGGIEAYAGSEPDISNCIFWNNTDSDLFQCQATYSWVGQEIEHESIEGLVAYWSFDNPSDAGHDDSGNGNDGSPVGGVTSTTGVLGGAVHLDGTGYINVPDSPSLDLPGGRGTIAAFIRVDPASNMSNEFGVSKESSSSYPSTIAYELLVRETASGKMVEECVISDGTSCDSISNVDGESLKDSLWHHIALTWSGPGGKFVLYRDGVEVIQLAQTISTINNIPEPVLIGAFRWNVPPGILRIMLGDIDEVRIYNRALSEQEIQQLYQNQPSGGPMFADPANGDYHLRSERGRYWPEHDVWVLDEVTSPCIDGGDPNDDYSDERMPNGGRINMGAFGGTAYASMSERRGPQGDINRDGVVDFKDFAIMADNWLRCGPLPPPGQASNPNPADGATGVSVYADLSWTAGSNAVSHDVYFGSKSPAMFRGNQTATTFDPGTMAYTTYYWRIDEVNPSGKTRGPDWRFQTGPPPR